MKKKNNNFWRFVQKMRFKYRVSVLNENTLIESWHVRLSRFSVILYTFFFTVITFLLLTILILKTPLRHYLPGYEDSGNRMEIIRESMRTDSLMDQMALQAEYLDMVKKVIAGEIKADVILSPDSLELVKKMTAITSKSKAEEAFSKNFEEEEKYNLMIMGTDSKLNEDSYVFFRPNRGTISSKFNLQQQLFGIQMATTANENILSVLSGNVIYAAYTLESKWVIIIQHANNYISVYKNNNQVLKKVGETVKAGETIAIGPDVTNNKSEQFYFELWRDGHVVNPEEYIIF